MKDPKDMNVPEYNEWLKKNKKPKSLEERIEKLEKDSKNGEHCWYITLILVFIYWVIEYSSNIPTETVEATI